MSKETNHDGTVIELEVQGHIEEVMKTALTYGLIDIDILPVTLEEIFLTFYSGSNSKEQGGQHV